MIEFSNQYLNLLNGKYSGLNLTRINEADEFYNKQIIDSILPAKESQVFHNSIVQNKIFLDIGFGGGFPLLPLAKCFPEIQFFGFEARGKKAIAVQDIANDLGLKNVKTFHQRYEEIYFDIPITISFKAVGKIDEMINRINARSGVKVFFYKGPSFYQTENLGNVRKDWLKIEEKEIKVPGTEGRLIIGFESVPRGTKNEKLTKFSELL